MMRNARFAAVTVVVALALAACGRAVQVPVTQAFEKRRAQAEAGDAEAQYALAMQLRFGVGVPQDLAAGAAWLLRAAEKGYLEAQFTLGLLYEQGRDGVPRDYVEAVAWLRTAAEAGHRMAIFELAEMYDTGRGVIKGPVLACMWKLLVAYRSTGEMRRIMLGDATYTARQLSQADRQEALRLAAEWDAAHL